MPRPTPTPVPPCNTRGEHLLPRERFCGISGCCSPRDACHGITGAAADANLLLLPASENALRRFQMRCRRHTFCSRASCNMQMICSISGGRVARDRRGSRSSTPHVQLHVPQICFVAGRSSTCAHARAHRSDDGANVCQAGLKTGVWPANPAAPVAAPAAAVAAPAAAVAPAAIGVAPVDTVLLAQLPMAIHTGRLHERSKPFRGFGCSKLKSTVFYPRVVSDSTVDTYIV